MKTLEDLEREAYITGDVELADLYAQLIDAQEELSNFEDNYEKDSLLADIDYWEERAIEAEKLVAKLQKKLKGKND